MDSPESGMAFARTGVTVVESFPTNIVVCIVVYLTQGRGGGPGQAGPNFGGLVLCCIDAGFSKKIFVGKF